MGVRDEVFPSKSRVDLVQTQWSEGWGYASLGFDEAARYLTEHRGEFGATVDHVGLVVFFLERHRIELALKQLLATTGREVEGTHNLSRLWEDCTAVFVDDADDLDEWAGIDAECREVLQIFIEHDASSYAFRYPTDPRGQPNRRPPYIDLGPIHEHVDRFVHLLGAYADVIEEGRQAEREYGGC